MSPPTICASSASSSETGLQISSTPYSPWSPRSQRTPSDAALPPADMTALLDGAEDPPAPSLRSVIQDPFEDRNFFPALMMQQLLDKPYHAVCLDGQIAVKRLIADRRSCMPRSFVRLDSKWETAASRLLFSLGAGKFAYYDYGDLTVYAATTDDVADLALAFRKYVRLPELNPPVGFKMLSFVDGQVRTEFVHVHEPLALSDRDLALTYGADCPSWQASWIERLRGRPSGEFDVLASPTCVGFWLDETLRCRQRWRVPSWRTPRIS